ncbi:MAG: PD-(D/E)XK nuclease family protein [Methanosarcinales archaeon]|nr:PD-(D/E)XK nuclease family protein [Methanosarcinales archaeon]MCD4810962.1 PD-(D/E)XK nuclease family protein [Methanosarcinales archaeon]
MNIFKELKRGNSREEEYFSVALAILLDEIPELTSYLLGEILDISDDSEEYEIILEYQIPDGRIDIAIKSIHYEIYIENKISSDLSDSQLERYSKHLESIDKTTKLILLTRDFIEDKTIQKYTDKYIFWTELYTLIELFTNSILEIDAKKYLLEQFLKFLREENMSDEKVSWEYTEGIKSFMNLLNMIQLILKQLKLEGHIKKIRKKSIGEYYAGFAFEKYNEGDHEFWIGTYYEDVNKLFIEIYEDFLEKHGTNKFKELEESPSETTSHIYDFDRNYFLAYSKKKQNEAIYNFIKESLDDVDEIIS